MRWRLGICKAFASCLCGAFFVSGAHALDTTRLWLPKTMQKHYLQLVRAAEVAETLERCHTILEGTIDREQSSPEHPHFRILCRQPNGKSYNEIVDGLSFETLTTPALVKTEPTPEELELQRQQEQARIAEALATRTAQAWQNCEAQMRIDTQLMMNYSRLTQGQPDAERVTESEVTFSVAFDAQNFWGETLRYQAVCVAGEGQEPFLRISKREIE